MYIKNYYSINHNINETKIKMQSISPSPAPSPPPPKKRKNFPMVVHVRQMQNYTTTHKHTTSKHACSILAASKTKLATENEVQIGMLEKAVNAISWFESSHIYIGYALAPSRFILWIVIRSLNILHVFDKEILNTIQK